MRWFVGADHAGYQLKDALAAGLRDLGDEVIDLGTNSSDSVDYPDVARELATRVVDEPSSRGMLVCGTGIGVSMAANKVPGARAAVVTDAFTAEATRGHNDANIVCFGARVIGGGVAQGALLAFRNTEFEGGRHQRRVDKIDQAGG